MWYVWSIKQHKFDIIKSFIKRDIPEIEQIFFPTVPKEFKRGNKVIKKRMALYSGYLYLKYDDEDHRIHYKLKSHPFITTFVGKDTEAPAINEMIRREEWNVLHKSVGCGDVVEVTSGPFKGFKGSVEAINGNKVSIFVDVFGREVKTSFPSEDLEIVSKTDMV